MHVFRAEQGIAVRRHDEWFFLAAADWDDWFRAEAPIAWLAERLAGARPCDGPPRRVLAPIASQEVWAAGVTYYRSRAARMEESEGSASCYDKVYEADRPELFFKATPHRVVGHEGCVRIRTDAAWNVPEPELAACVSSAGRIFGYTIGNDMSSRDLEGENPLYLPQAKVYNQCCALGPGVLVAEKPLPPETEIVLQITRQGQVVFDGATRLGQMKRTPEQLAAYLFRDNSFPAGCVLLTGTGIVPDADFTLSPGDRVRIRIEPIGILANTVVRGPDPQPADHRDLFLS